MPVTGGKLKKDVGPTPPDKKKHEEELESINALLREKEAALKAVGRPSTGREAQKETNADRDQLYSEQSKLRAQKDALNDKRRAVDEKIRDVNIQISKKVRCHWYHFLIFFFVL